MGSLATSKELCHLISTQSDEVALFFSGGKDSIALLDIMYPYFNKIHLVNMYFVKGLAHVDKYMTAAQIRYKNVCPLYMEHWIVSMLRSVGRYCLPTYERVLRLSDIDQLVRDLTGVKYTFYGMKKSDSLNRRLMLSGYKNAISEKNKVYPLSDWSNKEVLAFIKMQRLSPPVTYSSNKRSQGVFFNTDVFLWLQENYPSDLIKIYKKFPFSRQILFEHVKQIPKV